MTGDSTGDPVISQGRRPGRPRSRQPGSRVSTWITQAHHDRLCQIAQRRGESVSSLLRRVIVLKLKDDPSRP